MSRKYTGAVAWPRPSSAEKKALKKEGPYTAFYKIDGSHPLKGAVPGAYVEYHVRTRHGGKVFYFNFDLAREMGLIAKDHTDHVTPDLEKALLHAFSIQIINEYDVIHGEAIPPEEVRSQTYMATRYLQLQHPDKRGCTSGDGRSIWNGVWSFRGKTWDITSCGTGATRLSPDTVIKGRFFQTGEQNAQYGCGTADLQDAISAALMSEIFARNGIETERTLALIEFPDGTSINVRAGQNLIRPSHFLLYLRQEKQESLKQMLDYIIEREVKNGRWRKDLFSGKKAYQHFAREVAETFAKMAARFESDYIFVWLDWDGDNILLNGGIIDYGSVRQFGLFHHEYRFDDDGRWSTNIIEQRAKARETVLDILQAVDYAVSGKRRAKEHFREDPILDLFDEIFEEEMKRLLLQKVGFDESAVGALLKKHGDLVISFQKNFRYFERAKSSRGRHRVPDGISWDAIFCMRDLLRELPLFFLTHGRSPSDEEFVEIVASSYATPTDLKINRDRKKKIADFIQNYADLVLASARTNKATFEVELNRLVMRSSVINRPDRITGESIILIGEEIFESRARFTREQTHRVLRHFLETQGLLPTQVKVEFENVARRYEGSEEELLLKLMEYARDYKHTL